MDEHSRLNACQPYLSRAEAALAAVIMLFILPLGRRWHDFRQEIGTENLDAAYHSLLTVTALTHVPLAESRLLPLVTLANPRDKRIRWGATVPNKDGDYYIYTSFPPLASSFRHCRPRRSFC